MSTLRKIFDILTPSQRKSAALLLVLIVAGTALETLGIAVVIPAIALLTRSSLGAVYPSIQPLLEALGDPSRSQIMAGGVLVLVLIYVIKASVLALTLWRQNRFTANVQLALSQRLFATYLRQPYTFHLQRNSAQLIGTIGSEVGMFCSTLGGAMALLAETLVVSAIAGLLLIAEPVGALIVLLILGVVGSAFYAASRARLARWGAARQFHDVQSRQRLQQGLDAAKEVKLLGREEDFIEQYRVHNTEGARLEERRQTLQQLPRLVLELLAVIGLASLVLTMLAQNRDVASIVTALGLFIVGAFRLIPSVNRFLWALQSLRYGLPSVETLSADLALPVPSAARRHGVSLDLQEAVALVDVSYAYPSASGRVLRNANVSIAKGESIGLVGRSGAGKSTMVDVILGLLTPSAGQVRVDGRDIQDDLRGWQDQIGYVPQSVYLTDDTIRHNVALGLPDDQIKSDWVERAIRDAQLEEFVASLPDGLETYVGEAGVRLSGGQRQRIGIARALYHDPPVLVLDEATSALDLTTEQEILRVINSLHGRKTVVIVAHRLSTVADCDRLYRLDSGHVVEEVAAGANLSRASSGAR